MKAQQGQIKDLLNLGITVSKVTIVAEAGNDNGNTFIGEFLAKCGKKHYRIKNAKLIKTI